MAKIILVLSLVFIFREDVRYRQVSLWWFITGGVSGGVLFVLERGMPWAELSANVVAILIFACSAWLYVILRFRSFQLGKYAGEGDALYLLLPALTFPPVDFLLFVTAGTWVCTVLWLVFSRRLKERSKVPYAGLMAALQVFWIGIQNIF